MSTHTDEFSFLPAQAADLGLTSPLPRGERLTLTLPDGRKFSALRYGDTPPTVTFLHGGGLNAHTWDTTILSLGLPALAIDLAGHGDSEWRDDNTYNAQTLAPDVAIALQSWTDRPQLLVGQSLGGLTAAAVAANHPELVRSLVVIDITPGIDTSAGPRQLRAFFAGATDWATRDELVEHALSFGLGGARAAAERGVFHNSRVREDGRVEWKHHFAHLVAAAANNPEGLDALASAVDPRGWDDLTATHAPVLLIRGDHGFVSDTDAEEFVKRVPAASVVTLSTGHNVHEEKPAELATLLQLM